MTLHKIKVFLISKTYAESISHAFSRKEKHKEIFINFDNISMISRGKDNMLVKLIVYAENDEPIFEQIKENEKRISQNV